MFLPETILAGSLFYLLMLVAFKFPHWRQFHLSVMMTNIVADLAMPFYLYANRDWKERLIDGGEIFSFLIWMHLGLVLTLYALYVFQVNEGRKMLKNGDAKTRETHRNQGRGILLVKALVLVSGAMLYEPEDTPD